ncbi:hypothetical protein CDCA_CDCA17G4399 [Cyanidium caldarium]|uniref:SAYSvFN domain-containing protein n=1 Tax=Cyanidium caldarium TaxID=2771 RepID=A0AAV9J1E5_CYACA|nr:hypothetical protein CDCA_CDCA17G4399 [Cyanidium caldarium]
MQRVLNTTRAGGAPRRLGTRRGRRPRPPIPLWVKVRLALSLLWAVGFTVLLYVSPAIAILYLLLSIVAGIFASLGRGQPREPGRKSAYSLFNPNFEHLPGAYTAADVDALVRGRYASDAGGQAGER